LSSIQLHLLFGYPNHMLTRNEAPWDDEVLESGHTPPGFAKIYRDKYPVTPGHLLFVPNTPSLLDINQTLSWAYGYGRHKVLQGKWEGFNVGMNCGEVAGQTIMYPHIHLIPRSKGDTIDPVGGVRNVIRGKGNYHKGK
jgi:diadenosine tetraphosphate (Ap4A) HIT family hydrolase